MKCVREVCRGTAVTQGLCKQHRKIEVRRQGLYRVPAGPVGEHVAKLRASGLGWARIAELAGVATFVVRSSVNGSTILCKNARAILAVSGDPVDLSRDKGRSISVLGTRRRLRALVALGYTNKQLAAAIGAADQQIHGLLYQNNFVTAATARKVRQLFEELGMTSAPPTVAARRAIARAKRLGWAPPMAWDEGEIDNPDAQPHMVPHRWGEQGWAQRYAEYKELDMSVRAIAEMEGVGIHVIYRRLENDAA